MGWVVQPMRDFLPYRWKPVACCAEDFDRRWDVGDGPEPRQRGELSQEAAELEGQIKGTLSDLVGDDRPAGPVDARPSATGDAEDPSPEATGAFLGMVMAEVVEDDRALEAIDPDHPRGTWLFLTFGVILIALLLLGVVAYMSAIRTARPLLDEEARQATQNAAGAGATEAGAESTEGPSDAAGCGIPAGQIVVTNKVTSDLAGERDPDLFSISWDTTVTNNSPTLVLVSSRLASSNDGEAGWTPSAIPIDSNGNLTLFANYLNNNAGGVSGGLNWRLVGQVAVVLDTPECSALLATPEALPPEAIVAVPIPDHPADVEVPVS